LMINVLIISAVKSTMQYSAYMRCITDAEVGIAGADGSRSVIWFSLC
jgi:hypothetical protein